MTMTMTIKIDYFDTRYELIINNKGKICAKEIPLEAGILIAIWGHLKV